MVSAIIHISSIIRNFRLSARILKFRAPRMPDNWISAVVQACIKKAGNKLYKCISASLGCKRMGESKFPDYSLTFPWLVVKNTHFFTDPHFTYLQKEVQKMEPNG